MKNQTAPCPRCKKKFGWFERRTASYQQYFDANGEPTHAADSNLSGRGGLRKYCPECGRDITKLVKTEPI